MSTMDSVVQQEQVEYRQALKSINFEGHPAEGMMVASFGNGVQRGFKAGIGATHAATNVLIGKIHNGLVDLEGVKGELIALRDLLQQEAAL